MEVQRQQCRRIRQALVVEVERPQSRAKQ